MRLYCQLLSGLCLVSVCVVVASASPQIDDTRNKVVVGASDDDGAASQDATKQNGEKDEKDLDERARRTLRFQLNRSPFRVAQSSGDSGTRDQSGGEKKDAAAETGLPQVWLGIGLKSVEGDLANYLGSSDGVFIESVFPNSPAQAANLNEGDIIIGFQGMSVAGPEELVEALRKVTAVEGQETKETGDGKSVTYPSVTLTVLRRGHELRIDLTPVARPDHAKWAHGNEEALSLNGANIFKFGQPGEVDLKLVNPFAQTKSNTVVVVKEDGVEYVVRVEREGDAPPKITVGKDKEERQVTEEELEQLPEKVRDAIQKALKAEHPFEFNPSEHSGNGNTAHRQAFDEIREQLQKAMEQMGDGKLKLEGLGQGAIIVDPEKLHDFKKWSAPGVRGFSTASEQVLELKSQIEELKKQVDQLRQELNASKN